MLESVLHSKSFAASKAALTRALTREGFSGTGIDFKMNKDKPVARTVWLDLATEFGQKAFCAIIRDKSKLICYVHFAPPCGTASRAREVRVKDGPDPKPLRTNDCPDGLKDLEGKNLERVLTANKLYRFTAIAVVALHRDGIPWSIENPKNSLMWLTSWFSNMIAIADEVDSDFTFSKVTFHACMHGGQRDKATTFWYGIVDLSELEATCDGLHSHLPWGRTKEPGTNWATGEERNYPDLLCRRIATRVARHWQVQKPPKSGSHVDKEHSEKQARSGLAPLISEFKHILKIEDCSKEEVADIRAWAKTH